MKQLEDLASVLKFVNEYARRDAQITAVFTELNQTLVNLLTQRESEDKPDGTKEMLEAFTESMRAAIAGIQIPAPQVTVTTPEPQKQGPRVLDVVLHRGGRLGNGQVERMTITEVRNGQDGA